MSGDRPFSASSEEVKFLCQGNAAAQVFVEQMTGVLHFWDDLVDRDKPMTDATINQMMWWALVELPRNQFYAQNFVTLNTVLVPSILNWQLATRLERYPEADALRLEGAFIFRSNYVDILLMVAMICGGKEHADACAPMLRERAHSEGFAGYLKNLEAERIAREGKPKEV
jgi:hypothetical protein